MRFYHDMKEKREGHFAFWYSDGIDDGFGIEPLQ